MRRTESIGAAVGVAVSVGVAVEVGVSIAGVDVAVGSKVAVGVAEADVGGVLVAVGTDMVGAAVEVAVLTEVGVAVTTPGRWVLVGVASAMAGAAIDVITDVAVTETAIAVFVGEDVAPAGVLDDEEAVGEAEALGVAGTLVAVRVAVGGCWVGAGWVWVSVGGVCTAAPLSWAAEVGVGTCCTRVGVGGGGTLVPAAWDTISKRTGAVLSLARVGEPNPWARG